MTRRRHLRIAEGLSMPVDAVARTFAVLGQRGTGKTSTAVVLIEEMAAAGGQVAIVDPTGAWWGIASSSDGKGAGVPVVVFGGHHGDVPLEEAAGQLVAELIVKQGYSVVLDLELLRKGAQVRFMADFTEALYHDNRDALHLVVDEADRFAPQTMRGGDVTAARALGGLEDIVKLGRRKGLGCTLVTQRPATLNKNVLEQAETLIAHRLVGPRDRKAIAEWFEAQGDPGAEKEALAEIAKLARGTAYVFSPSFLQLFSKVKVRPKRTFDSSATPEVGAKRSREPTGRADVDLDALRSAMADTLERAKADDPRELRRRVKELQAQLAAREPERVEIPVLTDDARQALEQAAGAIASAQEQMVDAIADASRRLGEIVTQVGTRPAAPAPRPRERRPAQAPATAPRPAPTARGDVPIKAGARRMLEAVASLHPMPLTRAQVGTLAKVKRTGGTFGNYLGVLKAAGLLLEAGDQLTITQAGFDELGSAPPAPATPDELRAMWRDRLKAGARRMLDILIEAHPDWLTREELAEAAEVTSTGGTFGNYLGLLRTAGLIEESDGQVRAGDVLFLGAAR